MLVIQKQAKFLLEMPREGSQQRTGKSLKFNFRNDWLANIIQAISKIYKQANLNLMKKSQTGQRYYQAFDVTPYL